MTSIQTGNKDSEPTEVIFCIGSNYGNRKDNVLAALSWLSSHLSCFRHSPIYATPDCHGGQREYMNAVCIGKTSIEAVELEALCKKFEILRGRDAKARAKGDVPVDVDVVVYNGKVLRERDFRSEFFLKGYNGISIDTCHDD